MGSKERIFGLDLLRAAAVLLVVFHHSLRFTQAPAWLSFFGCLGEIGVGALLVLSGYLIGQGLIRKTREGRFSKVSHLGQFYARRWSRTFPPYYFYLFMMAALFPPLIPQLLARKEYFLFLQNFAWDTPSFYTQTWTLALLEFFYLLFPLLLVMTSMFVRNRLACLAVPMALLFFIPLALRAMHTQIETPAVFEESFRKWVVYRLDSPIIGVGAALIQVELPLVWAWFLRHSWIGLCTFSGLIIYHGLGSPYLFSSHWLQVFFYPLSALATAPLLPFLCNWRSNLSLFGTTMSSISQVSYSLYVSHVFAFSVGFCILAVIGIPHERWFISYPIYIPLLAAITYVSYYLTEEPFIRIREKGSRSVVAALGDFLPRIVKAFSTNRPAATQRLAPPLTEQPPA